VPAESGALQEGDVEKKKEAELKQEQLEVACESGARSGVRVCTGVGEWV
jgi:hypothetical protein